MCMSLTDATSRNTSQPHDMWGLLWGRLHHAGFTILACSSSAINSFLAVPDPSLSRRCKPDVASQELPFVLFPESVPLP